jgi:hypothetical protein
VGGDDDEDHGEFCGGGVRVVWGIHQLMSNGRGEHERQKVVVKVVYRSYEFAYH